MPQMAPVLLVKLEPSSSEFHIKNILHFRNPISWLLILTIIPLILCMKCSKYEYVTKKIKKNVKLLSFFCKM